MESGTFKTRLVSLLQRSRKAVRLYSEMEKSQDKLNYSDLQIFEWKNINIELLNELQDVISDFYNHKTLVAKVFSILERFQIEESLVSDNLKELKKELSFASQRNDFAKCADVSLRLVGIKAKNQALQAVVHELKQVISKSNLTKPETKIENPSPKDKQSSTKIISMDSYKTTA